MNSIARSLLQRELGNANDDLARAELESERSPEDEDLFRYIKGLKAKIRAIMEEIGTDNG